MLPLEGFVGRLHDVTFSPDGWLTVAVGDDATIHVWSGDGEKRTVTGAGSFRLVRFSQDGSRLATGDTKGRVTVRRTDTWEVVSRGEFSGVIGGLEFRGKTMSLGVGTYSPPSDEGRVHRRNLQIWDGRTTTSLRQDPPSDVGCRALSAATWHGRTTWAWLVDQRKVVIWETTRTDASSHVFPKECSAIVLSPDAAALYAACDWMIYRTDLTGAIQRSDFSGSKGAVNSLAMSPRGTHLLSGGNDKLIRLWNLSNLKEEFAYDWKIGRIERLAWSPDGLRAAAIGSEGALIWDIDNIGG